MKKRTLSFGFILIVVLALSSCSNERVLQLNQLPTNTPEGSPIYIMGDFNNWSPADSNFKLEYDAILKTYSIVLPADLKHITYKYTRGTNENIETDKCGNETAIRVLGNADFVIDTVASWMDLEHIDCPQITFIIQSKDGTMPNNEIIYLATETSQWQSGNPDYLFSYTINGVYALTIKRPKEKLLFSLFRGSQQQFDIPQALPGNNDTIMLSLSTVIPNEEVVEKEKPAKQTKVVPEKRVPTQTITLDIPVAENRVKIPALPVVAPTVPQPTTPAVVPAAPSAKPPVETKTPTVVPKPLPKTPPVVAVKPSEGQIQKKVMVIIDKIPTYGKDDNLYLAGDFNGWNIADPAYQFRSLSSGRKYLVLRLSDYKEHEFKITRGEPGTDESNYKEEAIDFHEIKKGMEDDTIHIRIDSWMDAYLRKRLVIYLIDVPENTPEREAIYLTGDFNNWNTKEERYKFTPLGDDRYALEIEDFSKIYTEYKITRGSMETEATARNGRVPRGQPFDFIKRDTIKLRIERWKDLK